MAYSSVELWTTKNVVTWLEANHLNFAVESFEENEVTGDSLGKLDGTKLQQQFGIKRFPDRERLLDAISSLLAPQVATKVSTSTKKTKRKKTDKGNDNDASKDSHATAEALDSTPKRKKKPVASKSDQTQVKNEQNANHETYKSHQ